MIKREPPVQVAPLAVAPLAEPEPLPDTPTYKIRRNGFWMTKYTVTDTGDNVIFEIRRKRTRYEFFVPYSSGASYTYRPRNWVGMEYVLVDTPVDYVMATFKVDGVIDPTGSEIGKILPEELPNIPSFKSLFDKERMRVMTLAARRKKYVCQDAVAARFNLDMKGGVDIYVLRADLRYMSKALAIGIGLRIVTAGTSLSASD